MSVKQKILIIGANGTVGTELALRLKKEGHEVVGTTSKANPAAGQARVNLATGEGVREAFEGVDSAFLLSPPGFADQHAILAPLIQEAKRRGLKKVVLMTALGANASETTPFRRAELELESSGLAYNILRPNWFFQNFHTFWLGGIKAQRKILLPAGTARVSFIDARDIAAVAAKLLTTSEFTNQAFDLTGPESVDHSRVAEAISKATGQKITYQDIPPAELQKGLLAAGLPADYVSFMLLIFGFLKEGYNAGLTGNVEKILGRLPRSLETYVNDHKQLFV